MQFIARRNELHTVFSGFNQAVRVAAGKQVADIASCRLTIDTEHLVDREMVVEAHQGDRKILMKGFQVDRQVGRQGGFADAAFLARNGHNIWCGHDLPLQFKSANI